MAEPVHVGDIEKTWTLQINGKMLELPRPSVKEVELPYLKRLRQQELEGIRDTYQLGSKDYRTAMEILQSGFNTRFFWGSEHFNASFRNERNLLAWFTLWARSVDPGITEADVRAAIKKSYQDTAALNEGKPEEEYVANPFYQVLGEALNDPNH